MKRTGKMDPETGHDFTSCGQIRTPPSFVTGHDFTGCGKTQLAAALKGHDLTGGGKTQLAAALKGHDFSRAAKSSKMITGFSRRGMVFHSPFFRNLFSRATKACNINAGSRAGEETRIPCGFVTGHDFTGCGKARIRTRFVTGHDFSRAVTAAKFARALAPAKPRQSLFIIVALFILFLSPALQAQRGTWRQATDAELASLLPARAPVEKEHIETEMRTASGIVNAHGRYIAGVVLLTAGYSADGKYSHYLIVQVPMTIGGVALKPGEYVFGWDRTKGGDALRVRFHIAATGVLVGTAEARRIPGSTRVESLHIWPPNDKGLMQIGRFGLNYEIGEE